MNRSVLVVDDIAANRNLLSETLETKGYEVLLASNYWSGSKAIRLAARGENPKVVWQGKRLSLLMSTPLFRAGHIYALDRKDGLKCIELQDGKVK